MVRRVAAWAVAAVLLAGACVAVTVVVAKQRPATFAGCMSEYCG